MARTRSEVERYGANWDQLRKKVLRRDDYTCQRCGHRSGPHAGEEGRVLQVHHVEKLSEGGANHEDNLVTLCQPCHGVQHPDNEVFDDHRGHAMIYPSSDADRRVAYVSSKRERERREEFLERKTPGHCTRCGNPPDGSGLYVYPNVSFEDAGELTHPAEKFGALCGPCTGLVYANDDDPNVEYGIYTADGRQADGHLDRLVGRKDQALLSGTRKPRKFGATRDPVNRKERVLFESPYRFVHWVWRRLGAAALAVWLFLLVDPGSADTREAFQALTPFAAGGALLDFYVFVGALLVALVVAFTVRWTVATVSDHVWRAVDDSIRPHHFRKDKAFALRRRLEPVGRYLAAPYLALLVVHSAFAL